MYFLNQQDTFLLLLLHFRYPCPVVLHIAQMHIFRMVRVGFHVYTYNGVSPDSLRLATICAWSLDLRKLFFSGHFPKQNSRSPQHIPCLLVFSYLVLCLCVQGTDIPFCSHSLGFLPSKECCVVPPPSWETRKQKEHVPTPGSWKDLQPLF